MKKILLIIFTVLFSINVQADGMEKPVTFNLRKDFYSEIVKTYENDTTVFYYKNKLLNMDLTNEQLKTILSQKGGAGSSRLTYYETMNIDVKPIDGTPYQVLDGKSTLYRANGGGSWSNTITHDMTLEPTAEIKPLNSQFWPWGFRIQYRTNENDAFINTPPSNLDLTNKTLEEQLASILNINLATTPNGVIDKYQTLYRFSPLANNTYLVRFDFLYGNNPTLKSDSTTEYLTNSLDLLGSEYVAIKYSREEKDIATIKEVNTNSNNKNRFISLISVCGTLILIITSYFIIKKCKYHK